MSVPSHIVDAAAANTAIEADRKHDARAEAPAWWSQLAGFGLALVFVFGIMGGWSLVQELKAEYPSASLYGELIFLGLVTWWGLVALSPLFSWGIRRLPGSPVLPKVTNAQGAVWAASIVVTVPILAKHGLGAVLLGAVTGLASWVGFNEARHRWNRLPHAPVCFSSLAAAIVLLVFAATHAEQLTELQPPPVTTEVAYADQLAEELRPLLFMDHEELFQPVDIDDADKRVCRLNLTAACDSLVKEISELEPDQYVKIVAAEIDPRDKANGWASAVFHHVFKEGPTLYVDYWWYFAENPAPVARSVLCGHSLTRGLLGRGCAEHPADWEGLTLMLVPVKQDLVAARCTPRPGTCVNHGRQTYEIREAHYAQHEKVVVYDWQTLQKRWRTKTMRAWAGGAGPRPLVFPALSSHASYAMPCDKLWCGQIATKGIPERRNGSFHWPNNHDCVDDCVKPLPTSGGLPSDWNAVKGRWGAQHCILFGTVCDTQLAPPAPAYQDRYRDPCPGPHCLRAKKNQF
jgi:hypothetical protein